jgi:hypothetical protein
MPRAKKANFTCFLYPEGKSFTIHINNNFKNDNKLKYTEVFIVDEYG